MFVIAVMDWSSIQIAASPQPCIGQAAQIMNGLKTAYKGQSWPKSYRFESQVWQELMVGGGE